VNVLPAPSELVTSTVCGVYRTIRAEVSDLNEGNTSASDRPSPQQQHERHGRSAEAEGNRHYPWGTSCKMPCSLSSPCGRLRGRVCQCTAPVKTKTSARGGCSPWSRGIPRAARGLDRRGMSGHPPRSSRSRWLPPLSIRRVEGGLPRAHRPGDPQQLPCCRTQRHLLGLSSHTTTRNRHPSLHVAHYRGLVLNQSTYRDADSGYAEATTFYSEE
jgi:hypothetical protein